MKTQAPEKFAAIFERHLGLTPVKYDHHRGTETPHLFTFYTEGVEKVPGRPELVGVRRSFSIGAADLTVLMDQHKLLRMQSNEWGFITLYFGE